MENLRHLFLLLMTSFSFIGLAQDTVTLRRTDWAGGICCSTGTQLQLIFTAAQPVWKVDSLVLELGDIAYPIYPNENWSVSSDHYRVNLGWNSQQMGEQRTPFISYYGVQHAALRKLDGNYDYERLRVYYANGKQACRPLIIERQFLAYP